MAIGRLFVDADSDVEIRDEGRTLVNRNLKVTFHSGETIGPFLVTWNHGMRDFLQAYEDYLKGGSQSQFRFSMYPDPKAINKTNLLLNFKDVAGISTVEVSP